MALKGLVVVKSGDRLNSLPNKKKKWSCHTYKGIDQSSTIVEDTLLYRTVCTLGAILNQVVAR